MNTDGRDRSTAGPGSEPPRATPLLECDDLSVCVPGRTLIERLTVHLLTARVVVVLGRNGAGKSSLLNALAGLNARATGEVRIEGRGLASWPRRDLARRLALLPQASDDPFPGTALDSVLVGRHPHIDFWRWESAEDRDIARGALAAADLAGCDERDVGTLSGGERRRLAIAAVLAQDPQVFLLDEPVQQLDPHHQVETVRLFRKLADSGRLVVMSLHDVGLAARFADEAILLYGDGRWRHGTAHEVLDAATLSGLYGTPLQELRWTDGRTFVPA